MRELVLLLMYSVMEPMNYIRSEIEPSKLFKLATVSLITRMLTHKL